MEIQVKIKAHDRSACLQDALAASWLNDSFTDLAVSTFARGDDNEEKRELFIRVNKSVLAAASPVLARLLADVPPGEETASLVFANYSYSTVMDFLFFIYHGYILQNTDIEDLNCILEEFGIGIDFSVPVVELRESAGPENVPKSDDKVDVSHDLSPQSLNLPDLSSFSHKFESLQNPEFFYGKSVLEKMALRYSLLPNCGRLQEKHKFDFMIEKTDPDLIGIYWDATLHHYYGKILRRLPPFRIYSDNGTDSVLPEIANRSNERKVNSTYNKNAMDKVNPVTRKSFGSARIAVSTYCRVGGKLHLVMSGTKENVEDFPEEISDYDPHFNENNDVFPRPHTEQVAEVFNEEFRRKRVLLSTLSRLKREYLNARKLAIEILRGRPNMPLAETAKKDASSVPKTKPKQSTVCDICGKLVSVGWLKVHIANHKGSKPYLCEHCGRSFAASNLLKSHTYHQHSDSLNQYNCDFCLKTFRKKSHFQVHMRIHNQERPFPCTVCEKSFHTNGNLQKHLIIHSGIKPFKCGICEKAFKQPQQLKTHSLIHDQGAEAKRAMLQTKIHKKKQL